jgi:hypothetical protein
MNEFIINHHYQAVIANVVKQSRYVTVIANVVKQSSQIKPFIPIFLDCFVPRFFFFVYGKNDGTSSRMDKNNKLIT